MFRLCFILTAFFLHFSLSAQYTVSGGSGVPYDYKGNLAGMDIQSVFLVNGLSGATITYTSASSSASFYYYQTSVSDKVDVPSSDIEKHTSGGETQYTISNIKDGRGYLAEIDGVLGDAVWIIDYALHQPVLNSVEVAEDDDRCDYLKLLINKSDELFFYGQSGVKRSVDRKYSIEYADVEWNSAEKKFVNIAQTVPESVLGIERVVPAPYTDTHFTVKGDQFAKHFEIEKEIATAAYQSVAVQAYIDATKVGASDQSSNDEATEGNNETENSLSGSAPLEISFKGYGNEPVAYYYTWFIYKKSDLENVIARYTDKDIRYTFNESGDYLIRLEVADRSSTCAQTAEVTLNISESMLDVPNFYAPDSDKLFRVSYKSLVSFKCTIFNNWGNKIYQWTDPAQGWDGKYKGRIVNPGVYFYVIEAKGSDGINYKKKGDINVLHKK